MNQRFKGACLCKRYATMDPSTSSGLAGLWLAAQKLDCQLNQGFCGYAMALNKLRPINPELFDVVDGRLILQHSQDAYNQFHKDLPGLIAKADGNWPAQVKKHAGKKVKFDKPAQPAADTR